MGVALPENLVRMQILIPQAWDGACDPAFLTRSKCDPKTAALQAGEETF